MASARLPALLFLILFIKVNSGQQINLDKSNFVFSNQLGSLPINNNQQQLQQTTGANLIQKQLNQMNARNVGTNLNFQPNCYQQQNLQQQPNLQQQQQQQINLQPQFLQQQNPTAVISNLQLLRQQVPVQTSDASLTSTPITNVGLTGYPIQLAQSGSVSNPGIITGIPTAVSSPAQTTCNNHQPQEISVIRTQNPPVSQGIYSNMPIAVFNGAQLANAIPISSSNFAELPVNPNPAQPTYILAIPASMPVQNVPQNVEQVQTPVVTLQAQPMEVQSPMSVPQSQTITVQAQPVSQPVVTQSQPQQQPSLLTSLVSQLPSVSPSQYSSSPAKQGTKSSNLKALLPLLFNLLKEKNGCGCRHSCNCCNNNTPEPLPQVNTGYSNQINYSKFKEENSVDSEEEESNNTRKVKERKKPKKYKPKKIESEEADDEYVEDENED